MPDEQLSESSVVLHQKDARTINEHLGNIFEEGEPSREATIRKFRMVRLKDTREVEHALWNPKPSRRPKP